MRPLFRLDALGKETKFCYNVNTNVLEWVQYPEDTADTRTNYTYDDLYRTASAAAVTQGTVLCVWLVWIFLFGRRI